jgi:hypothetical protein
VGIKAEGHQNSNEDYKQTGGNNKFRLKYSQSGGGSCAAARGTAVVLEGKQITDAGYKITYTLTTDKSGSDPTKTIISAEEFEANPVQLDGIIDVTEPGEPMINEIKLKKRLTPDTYYLRITIGTDVYIMSWNIKNTATTSSSSSTGNVSKSSSSNSGTGKSSSSNKVTSSSSKNDSKSSSSNVAPKSSSSKSENNKDKDDEKNENTKPSCRVKMTAPFEFEIVMNESSPNLAKRYSVMDMKGQVLSVGELSDKGARVNVPTYGSYVVKVGLTYELVNVR